VDLQNQPSSKKKNSQKANLAQPSELANLLDLQDFLTSELIDQGTAYRRAFIPITEGLGLDSPRNIKPKIEIEPEPAPVIVEAAVNSTEPETQVSRPTPPPLVTPLRLNENRLAEVMESSHEKPEAQFFETKNETPQFEINGSSNIQPPPLPRPSLFKRVLAGVIDQVFVLFIWTGMVVLTSNLLNDFSTGFSIDVITDFSHPRFQRIAVLEFAAAWLGYLGFSLLIFKRTFGMWVWSIGVSYGDKVEENYTLRKAMRIFWTFIFSAPIAPSILLVIRKNGRNILDVLSGTNVYDSN
jgi:hypothetical protein